MVSDRYRVNVAMCNEEVHANESEERVIDIKGSISNPIPSEDVASVLEYFGITPSERMDNQYTMQNHNRLTAMPERVHQGNPKCASGDASSTASFSAWRSNCRNPIYSSRYDELWPRLEYWWNMLKWPLVLLLICSILGLFIYFLVVEMEINESLYKTDRVVESNIYLREMKYQEIDGSWMKNNEENDIARRNDSGKSKNKLMPVQRPYSSTTTTARPEDEVNNQVPSSSTEPESTTSGVSWQKQYGFTSGHQNNFGVPIEEDARILKRLNDELIRIHNGTTTARISTTTLEYKTKVSPTLPLITKSDESATEQLNITNLENDRCVSTSLPLCRGVLHYDLTINSTQGMTDEETILFKYLLDSRCSSRAAQFMCSLFEPECRPSFMADTLPPCKRFCKSILEPCSQAVANSELLTELFDCDIYPESHDAEVCNDPTRFSKCTENEFKCGDSSCIPQQWRCDNIKDCANGEDEEHCKFCEQDEFKCTENDKCIPDDWRCDQYKDCPSGSDELDCIDDDSRSFPLGYGTPARVYPFAQEVAPNEPNRQPYRTFNDEVRQRVADQEHATSNVQGRQILVSNLANFQDSTEIMMTSDTENKLKYVEGLQTAHVSPCPEGELRCLNGRCISLTQLCDKVADCADGSDEAMCQETTEDSSNIAHLQVSTKHPTEPRAR